MLYRPPRNGLPLRLSLGACLVVNALPSAGCEWVLGGVPRELSPVEASVDGAAAVVGPVRDAGPRTDGGPALRPDDAALSPEPDAGEGAPVEDAGEPVDAAPEEPCDPDAGATYYADSDGDGYGRDGDSLLGCAPPGGGWVRQAGDCNDEHPDVYPGQKAYFDAPYPIDGVDSFDYDCSGSETGNGKQPVFLGCGLLDLLVCVGQGYAPTGRNGLLQNSTCGSEVYANCRAALLVTAACVSESMVRTDRFLCH
jgi:hypothetical protein